MRLTTIRRKFNQLSLKNKMFLSLLTVIFLLSLVIALFTRWLLISSLAAELKLRGAGIAQSLADSGRGFILTENAPELSSLIFDARFGARKDLVAYIFILNKQKSVIAHTFMHSFPADLERRNPLPPDRSQSIKLLRLGQESVYDVAVPVNEGIYRIGSVHIGIVKQHIDHLIGKLRITFVGFLSAITILFFGITHWLSRFITRPISELTRISDEIARGASDIRPFAGAPSFECWRIKDCGHTACPAHQRTDLPCWYVDDTVECGGKFPDKLEVCRHCEVHQSFGHDEVAQLAYSFTNMTIRLTSKEAELRESEEKYRSLFTSGPNPIFVVDRATFAILDANPKVEEIFQYPGSDLLDRPFVDLAPPEERDELLANLTAAAGRPEGALLPNVQLLTKGLSPLYVNAHSSPIRYQDRDALIISTPDITKIQQLLHRFQVANAQRKAVLNSASQIAIMSTDIRGVIAVFNSGAENLLGYKAKEVIGKQTPLLFHTQEELDRRGRRLSARHGRTVGGIDIFFEYARQGQNEQQEWTYVRRDGGAFPVNMSINAFREEGGALTGFLCIAIDITEKKRSEKALRESERNYRLLVNNLPNVIYKGYADGSIDFFDDKIEALTGYSRQCFLDREKTWFDIVYEPDIKPAQDKFRQALKGSNSYVREYRFKAKNGATIWIEEGGQIVCDADGQIEFISGAFLDITERKRAEEALQVSEEKYRSLFDGGPSPVFVLDKQTFEILDANPSAEEIYGYAKQELIGRPFADMGPFGFDNSEPTFEAIESLSKVCLVSQKVIHYKKGGEPFYVRVMACSTRYGRRDAIILSTTDITEVIEKDAQLIQASKMTMLGEMSAGIAHELNQPLNAIKMGNEYLKMMIDTDRRIPPEDLHRVAAEVSEQVDRASDIINQLRLFGRKSEFEKEKIDINRPIMGTLRILTQQLNLSNIRVDLDLTDNLPHIMAQRNRMEQVFFNLITNARDAINQTDEKDRGRRVIAIRTFLEQDQVVAEVADTGLGIREELRQKIFEPFFTTKEVGKGMGLGLSISYGIIKDYGGDIAIASQIGRGSTVTLRFPAEI